MNVVTVVHGERGLISMSRKSCMLHNGGDGDPSCSVWPRARGLDALLAFEIGVAGRCVSTRSVPRCLQVRHRLLWWAGREQRVS